MKKFFLIAFLATVVGMVGCGGGDSSSATPEADTGDGTAPAPAEADTSEMDAQLDAAIARLEEFRGPLKERAEIGAQADMLGTVGDAKRLETLRKSGTDEQKAWVAEYLIFVENKALPEEAEYRDQIGILDDLVARLEALKGRSLSDDEEVLELMEEFERENGIYLNPVDADKEEFLRMKFVLDGLYFAADVTEADDVTVFEGLRLEREEAVQAAMVERNRLRQEAIAKGDKWIEDPFFSWLAHWHYDRCMWAAGDIDGDGLIDHLDSPADDFRAFAMFCHWVTLKTTRAKNGPYPEMELGPELAKRWLQFRDICERDRNLPAAGRFIQSQRTWNERRGLKRREYSFEDSDKLYQTEDNETYLRKLIEEANETYAS